MPALYILAGPNGTGKTTYYNTALDQGFIDHTLPAVLIDNSEEVSVNIARIKNGHIVYKHSHYPEWAQGLLYICERLTQRSEGAE